MRNRIFVLVVGFGFALMDSASLIAAVAPPVKKVASCRVASFEGELQAGEALTQPIGGGLKVWFQPIASGWILRVIPSTGPMGEHDYAGLATPPYESVSPLSVSTDFAFRAQDAVGWNPRRFKFATSSAEFGRLSEVYQRFVQGGATPPAPVEMELSEQIAEARSGKLTILDARLVPGVADQWRMAAVVASHFTSTAHTLVDPADGKPSALGRLVWVRFRLEMELPDGFAASAKVHVMPRVCGSL